MPAAIVPEVRVIVMKFGGTSVGEPAHFRTAVGLVRAAIERDPVIVVSALSGVTDLLAEYHEYPERRAEIAQTLETRHLTFADSVGLARHEFAAALDDWRDDDDALRDAVMTPEERDRVLAHGERISAQIFAAGLRAAGVPAAAVLAGDIGLVTDENFGDAHPLESSERLMRAGLANRPPVPVVTGFLGRTESGRITTLGRGGSDYSAALVGAALGADEIQIWTDTSGMLSADPRIVPEARPVPRLSFAEASELAYFGAKVLHPKTLLPAVERNIPVRILNTLRPEDPGSLIVVESEAGASPWDVKSIACKKGITAITIVSTRMLLAHGFLARVFEVFARHRVVVDLVTTSEVSISVTVDLGTGLVPVMQELEGIGRVELRTGLAVVAVVGEGAPRRVGLAGQVFTLLGAGGVRVEMISQGASRVNLSFVISESAADRAVRLLHGGLGLDAEVRPKAEVAGR